MTPSALSRRNMMKSGALALAGFALAGRATTSTAAPAARPTEPEFKGLKIGVASYTLRSMKVDAAVKAIQRVGLKYVSIKDFHLSLKSTKEERQAVVKQFKDGGIEPLSCGVITFKAEADTRAAFDYAKDCGIPTIVCHPNIEQMDLLDKLVKDYDIKLAIHNHGPESKHYPTPHEAYKLAEKCDSRIGLCIDVGHTARSGADPAECILKYKDRLLDAHLKDISKADAKGGCVEAGRGVLDIKGILKALVEIKYSYLAGFEYEKDGNDPMPGLAETVGYVRGMLAAL